MLEPVHHQLIKKQEPVKDSSHKLMQERPMKITEKNSKLMRRKKMIQKRLRKKMRVMATIRNLSRV